MTLVAGAGASAPSSSAAATGASASAVSNPSSVATSDAVSRSISWLIVAKIPLLMSSRITSAGLTARTSASSLTVIVDGSTTALRSRGSATETGVKPPPSRRCGLRGPRRPRVPLLLLAIRPLLLGRHGFGVGMPRFRGTAARRRGRPGSGRRARAAMPLSRGPPPGRQRRRRRRRPCRGHAPSGPRRPRRPAFGQPAGARASGGASGRRRRSGSDAVAGAGRRPCAALRCHLRRGHVRGVRCLGPVRPREQPRPRRAPTRGTEAGSWACASLRMSIRQPVILAASRAFWPSRPIASESIFSGTTTFAIRCSSSMCDRHDLGRAERLGDEDRRVLAPFDHVDLLAGQLGDHRLDACAALADRCPDGVEALLAGRDGHLASGCRARGRSP